MAAQRRAIIVDATGLALTPEETALFRAEKPVGFILFKRNCQSRDQVRRLVDQMRAAVDRADAPVLIDQEGGSVARLKSPEWREYPSARRFGELAVQNRETALRAARLNAWLMARDLQDMGITVNCAPVVDVPAPDCHAFLAASRTFHADPALVAALGGAVCRGLLEGAVTPVIKHIPGHGRARVDSHYDLPRVDTSQADLQATDFAPFAALAKSDMKTALWAMAAHVVYSSIDPDSAASESRRITDRVVRGDMGFAGVLLADDVSMKALGGSIAERVKRTLDAGMDVTMICNASFDDRRTALEASAPLSAASAARLAAAEEARGQVRIEGNDNRAEVLRELESLFATADRV